MRLVLIVEDRVGFITGKILADRVLIECGPDWIDVDSIDSLREWTGLDGATPFTKWTEVPALAQSRGIRVHGRTEGPDYMAARRALTLAFADSGASSIAAVVLVRDMDNQPRRRRGLGMARDHMAAGLPFQVAIAAADPEGEAWIMHAFCAESDAEKASLAQAQTRLGFDPRRHPEWLRGDRQRDGKGAERDLKRVLSELAGCDPVRQERCLESVPLRDLMELGHATGVADYLVEVRDRLLPLLDPGPPKPCDL